PGDCGMGRVVGGGPVLHPGVAGRRECWPSGEMDASHRRSFFCLGPARGCNGGRTGACGFRRLAFCCGLPTVCFLLGPSLRAGGCSSHTCISSGACPRCFRIGSVGGKRGLRRRHPMMHLFLNALAANAGGGLTYLRNVLPHLSARNDVRTTAAVNPTLGQELEELPNVSFLEFKTPANTTLRFWQEQTALPELVRRSGAQVLISSGNFGLRKC